MNGFSKRAVKCIRARIELIRQRKQVAARFLKQDVADLIAGGHELNAFKRVTFSPLSPSLLLFMFFVWISSFLWPIPVSSSSVYGVFFFRLFWFSTP